MLGGTLMCQSEAKGIDIKMKCIILKKPFITNNYNRIRINLEIIISAENERRVTLWYEVASEYGKYLYKDRVDPFLVAILPYCMKEGYDIRVESNGHGGGVSADLLYQVSEVLIPSLKKSPYFIPIDIQAEPIYKPLRSGIGVATGVSGGVDSFYTILKHMEGLFPLTHLVLFNIQSFGEYGGDVARKHFYGNIEKAKKICNDLNLKYGTDIELITVDSNIQDELPIKIYYAGTYRDAGAILLLRQIFKLYYFSSTHGIEDFSIEHEVRDYDLWNLSCLSTQNCRIQIFGLDVERIKKLEYISKFSVTYDNLNICLKQLLNGSRGMEYANQKNCTCDCEKCVYTVMALKGMGKLDKYEKVFDLNLVEKNYPKLLAEVVAKKKSYLFKETYELLKQTGEITDTMEMEIGAKAGGYDDIPKEHDTLIMELMDLFFQKIQKKFSLSDELIAGGYRMIAIYGMGRLGKRLYSEIKDMTAYGIDRNNKLSIENLEIKNPKDELPLVDLVIITTVYDTEAIRKYLKGKMECEVLTLREVLERN